MEGPICYFALDGDVHHKISSSYIPNYTPQSIAYLRGLYEMETKKELIPDGVTDAQLSDDDIRDIADKLIKFKNKKSQERLKELKDSTKHVAKTFAQLYEVDGWNETTRRNRINAIANSFSVVVSNIITRAKEMGINLTREQVVNGYKANGKYHYGQHAVFDAVFDEFINKFNEAREIVTPLESLSEEDREAIMSEATEAEKKEVALAYRIVEEYPKIFNNWAALCTFARMSLRDTESLKLGATLEYAAPTTPDNFSLDAPLEDSYNIEEAVKEAWMTHVSETSSFSSLGTEVRRFLSTISDVDDNGETVIDDLNFIQQMDPLVMHRQLEGLLRGVTSEGRMITKLKEAAKTDTKIQALLTSLETAAMADFEKPIDDVNRPKNPVILTQLLLDMHKNMVNYSALVKFKNKIIAKILNKEINPLHTEFTLRMDTNTALDAYSIYNEDGTVNWENLASWYKESIDYLPGEESKTDNNVFNNLNQPFYKLSGKRKIEHLVKTARALGIPLTQTSAAKLLSTGKFPTFRDALKNFRYWTNKAMSTSNRDAFDVIVKYNGVRPSTIKGNTIDEITAYDNAIQTLKDSNLKYTSFLSAKKGAGQESSKGFGYEGIAKMLDQVAEVSEYLKTERRASWFDRKGNANSRFADRSPSYMGDLVDKIHEFVSDNDAIGLKNFIMDKWGSSTFFYKDGKFLNSWLEQMYNSIKEDSFGNVIIDKEAFAKVFEFEEFLGSNIDGKVSIFENFTEKQHAEAMLKQFMEKRDQNSKSGLAKYPCFILGDSGAQMFFTANRYDITNKDARKSADAMEKLLNGFRDVFTQEIERRKYVLATNKALEEGGYKLIDNFSDTANEFTMLTFLNHTFENGKYWKILTGNNNMSDTAVKALTKEQAMQESIYAIGTDALTNAINAYMKDSIDKFTKKLVSVGILAESKGDGGAITYTPRGNFFNGNLRMYNNDVSSMIKDFFWNTKYATIQQLQMFTVDPSFYDHRYPVKDLQKRYKEIYAPGKKVSIEARDYDGRLYMDRPYERVVYFDDIKLNSEVINPAFYNVLKEVFKDKPEILKLYTENTLTDGQGYRTLDSYRAVKGMSGEWTPAMESAYLTIKEIRNSGRTLNESDIKKIAELAVLFQPIKPYLYTLEKLEINKDTHDTVLIPVQHKYAEIVLIPELLADGKLKDIARWMENHTEVVDGREVSAPIDMIASTKCVKVGSFGSVDIKGKKSNSFANQVEANKANLNIPRDIKTDSNPVRLVNFAEHLDFNIFVGNTYNAKLDFNSSGGSKVEGPEVQLYILGYDQAEGQLPTEVWFVRSDAPNEVHSVSVSTMASWIDAAKGQNAEPSLEATLSKAFVHNLSWSDYRIQSGVPEHLNYAQLFGTQIRKLILAGIQKGANYNYLSKIFNIKTDDPKGLKINLPGMGDVYLNGRNLVSLYNCLVMANMFDSYETFESQVSTNKALSDKLIQNVISNSSQAEDNAFGFSLIEDGDFIGEFVIPPGEPGMEHDASALLNSLFKKNVNKQKIKGGSAVQASSLGLSGYTDAGDLFEVVSPEGDNVLYDEVEMPFNCSYLSFNGKAVHLKFEDWCNTDGTLKMSNDVVYGEDALEYLSWPVSSRDKYGRPLGELDENGYDKQGYQVPLIEKSYPGILNIIAYRIPTEMEYSMVNCKVFRFSNPLTGGTLKIPSSRTTTGGFDFDIDKLYFFMKEFAQNHLTDRQIDDIWKAIYNDPAHAGWHQRLIDEKKKDSKGKDSLSNIIDNFFSDNGELSSVGDINQKIDAERDYHYWEAAELPGTASEAFTKYLEEHRKEYPVFDTYNPELSPLNPVKDEKGNIITAGNSRVARNNLLIDLMRARLMDKETLKQRYTPGGFAGNSDAALRMRVLKYADRTEITSNGRIDWTKVDAYVKRIRDKKDPLKDPEPEFDVSDPTTILTYNQQNQVAGKLIGIFANQNTNHVYSSLLHRMELAKEISFGNHTANGLKDFLNAPEGIDVDVNVAEYLAASVDAVKDPVLNYLNLNIITADAGAVLARIGYTPMEIGLLFSQPVIKEICDYVANEGVTTDMAIAERLSYYGGKGADLSKIQYLASEVTTDKLADNVLKASDAENSGNTSVVESDEFKRGQLHVLALFNEILADTADVNSFVQSTRFTAANSIGSTFGDQLAQEQKVQIFIDKYISKPKEQKSQQSMQNNYEETSDKNEAKLVFELFDPAEATSERMVSAEDANMFKDTQGILNNNEALLDLSPEEYMATMSRNPLAFEQCMMDLTRKATNRLFSRHFPYHTTAYKNMRYIMGNFTKYGSLDAETINSLHREFIVYLLSRQQDSLFDGEGINTFADKYMSNRDYYNKEFPAIISRLKNSGSLQNIPFFAALSSLQNDNELYDITVQGMGGLQSRTSNMITEMWADAFKSDAVVHYKEGNRDIAVKDLARDMFFYNYYKLGFNFHPTVFMNLAPTMLKLGLRINTAEGEKSYINFIRDIINGNIHIGDEGQISFAKQYMLNHLDNNKFVLNVKGETRKHIKFDNANQTSFTISRGQLGKTLASLFTVADKSITKNEVAFRPIVAIESEDTNGNSFTRYYMADSGNARFNVTTKANGTMRYKEVYPQGVKGKLISYYNDANFKKTLEGDSIAELTNAKTSRLQEENPIGTPEGVEENSFIQIEAGDDITGMFTEEQWMQMYQDFISKYKDQPPSILPSMREWRMKMYDTSNFSTVEVLNDLLSRLSKGWKPKTIDGEGKETTVCG